MRAIVAAALLFLPSVAPSQSLDVGDARLTYTVQGSGRAVVLIHGWALSLREWDDQIAALAPYYRVIAYDRRGYGRSTGFADPTADPGDLRALLDTLHIRSAVLVGHSGGADVASRFAAAFPERVDALVLYGGAAPEGFPVPSQEPGFEVVKALARQHGLDSMWRVVEALPMFRPGLHRTAATAARLDSILAGYHGSDILEDHPAAGAFPPTPLAVVRQWPMPVLFISGERESPRWHLVTDSLTRWMPNARKVVIAGGGHGVHLDEPAAFNAALLDFLRSLGSR
jgi:pimeloyl-ACP methyl ester carboxylesterase